MVADDVPHAVGEDLRAAAGHRVHPGILHALQRLGNRHLAALGQKRHLHHGERLDMHLGKALLQPAHQVHEVLKRQIGMQAADDVKLGHRLGVARARSLPRLFERHRVRSGLALLAAEGAQPAGGDADIGRIDVAIDVEVGHIAVQPLAHQVRQPAHRQNVAAAVERHAIVEAEPLAALHLLRNGQKSWIVCLERVSRPRAD